MKPKLVIISSFFVGLMIGGLGVSFFKFKQNRQELISTSTSSGKALVHDLSRLATETNPQIKQSISNRVIRRLEREVLRQSDKPLQPFPMPEDHMDRVDERATCHCDPTLICKKNTL